MTLWTYVVNRELGYELAIVVGKQNPTVVDEFFPQVELFEYYADAVPFAGVF